ncbi:MULTISPECIES: phage antirepressor [Lysinibacillus]|jgi:anti-repressor protein|uniref:Phage repressor protein/antirepressor Ant n=1 Tax=Lysinibacillus fusiformis TaxID=28031 RepID=A0A2I0V494_9BACI|nr:MULTISPECIES: phage antirepressor [Lysinibacillus]KUF36712.1 antirepressor [Lysinibacillus sp. F5]MEE3807266.1 phage antirepressor [Lysinibacillus fusiformis]PKU53052.1 phage repressor protein/antirepressor Ant [Lysinibacillus fusiformis]WCH48998.1 phage antirepressor [Lysinibacillus sp. OF-1]SCX93202.1 Prophage antirepressor [Lysinibacillus sp. SG9]
MNRLQTFNFHNQNVRIVELNNEPWFVAADVCRVLALTNPTVAINRLENDERSKFNLGRQGETNIVNESGLYELIFASRKPTARAFKKWVKSEVLPSVRKDGGYITTIENDDDASIMAKALLIASKKIKNNEKNMVEQRLLIDSQKTKVLFADAIQASETSILIGEFAKILKQNGIDVGQKRLFKWLRENGYLIKRKGSAYNSPTQKSMQLGLFEIKETPIHHNSGEISISKTSKITSKGQAYFINKFLGKVVTI